VGEYGELTAFLRQVDGTVVFLFALFEELGDAGEELCCWSMRGQGYWTRVGLHLRCSNVLKTL